MPPITAGILLMGGWAFIQALHTPVPPTALPPSPPALAAGSASPFVVTFPERLILVTETPIPPTVTPEPPPETLVADLICGEGVPVGAVCTMPTATLSPPTPMPNCPVGPGQQCISQGGSAPLMTTTTPESNTTSGSVNDRRG